MQDFYPTPSTASTCMFYTGIDPFTGKEIYVAKTAEEKAMQRRMMVIPHKGGRPEPRDHEPSKKRELKPSSPKKHPEGRSGKASQGKKPQNTKGFEKKPRKDSSKRKKRT